MVRAFPYFPAVRFFHRSASVRVAPGAGEIPAESARGLLAETLMSNDSAGGGGEASMHPELVSQIAPEQILQEDEVVLLLTKPSVFYIFYSSFRTVLGTLMLGILAARMTSASAEGYFTPRSIAAVTVLICLGRLIWALLVWTSHIYMLTNQRVVTIKGVINVHMFQTHLRKIQKIEMYRPLVQRFLGTATIGFATAAAGGNIESTWVMIARPVETHEQIVAAINKSQSR